jgi:hypothetical protein
MPTYIEDIPHIQIIPNTIFNHIHNNPNSRHILMKDFNKDIALIGRHNGNMRTNPTQQDIQWKQFTDSLHLNYIPTNPNYTHQGRDNYIHSSLIDGFYINTPHNIPTSYQTKTNTNQQLNSDHHLLILNIPLNTLISKTHTPTTKKIN